MTQPRPLPPLSVLKEQLHYDPLSGKFFRKKKNTRWTRVGEEAGGLCQTHGYIFVHVVGYGGFRGHRLAWKMHYGTEPPREIDHINRNRADNRISNLRAATREENTLNKSLYASNKSGYRGVCYKPANKKWVAQITRRNQRIYLGLFSTPEEASEAYNAARLRLTGRPAPS